MGTEEPVPDCAVVVGGELEQSLEEEGRTDAASDIVKVKDWVQPSCSVGIIKQSHTHQSNSLRLPVGNELALYLWYKGDACASAGFDLGGG